MKQPGEVLEYWFGPFGPEYPADNADIWWKKNPAIDTEIKAQFGSTLEASARGDLAGWSESKNGRLAHIILIDQMSRNMHRDSPMMYAQDDLAQELSLRSLISGDHFDGHFERMFQYMPLMHAENVIMQRLCVHLFAQEIANAAGAGKTRAEGSHDFAIKHLVIVERFGRFPHRNAILERKSTPDEVEFLKQPGSSF